MPTYLAPDIYVEEVAGGARPIEAVGTSTAGFVGVSPDASVKVNQAIAINNWTQFLRDYAPLGSKSTDLSNAVFGFFQNGGSRCYVTNIGENKPISEKNLESLEAVDEIAIIAAPGFTDAASYDALLTHCEKLQDRVAILDAPKTIEAISQLAQVATASAATTARRGAAAAEAAATPTTSNPGLRPRQSDGGYGSYYFPWITVRDPLSSDDLIDMPPSGHLAGIWARTDATRGVHKAPANEIVRGALSLAYRLSRAEQAELNSAGVNCIRFFAREGIRVWGARTVAASSSEWRYLNVRRLTNMIKESIANSTRWIVFEPNDQTLWKSIRRDARAFLMRLWREGALMGETPDRAFFVKCDAETNPSENIDAGIVTTLIGIAPVKPAEFIVFRISQYQAGQELEPQGQPAGGARG
jgi:uncharacterized protein